MALHGVVVETGKSPLCLYEDLAMAVLCDGSLQEVYISPAVTCLVPTVS